jgi:O-antigen ligase
MLLFSVNVIIFTASRTGYLTLVVAAILILALSEKHRARLSAVIIASALAAVLFVPTVYKERFISSFTGKEAEGASAATRKALFVDSVHVFAENPLGVGLGGFKLYQAAKGRNAQDTHNLYTEILAEAGIQGFICFGIFMGVVLRRAVSTRKALRALVEELERLAWVQATDLRVLIEEELRNARLLLATTTAVIVFIGVRLFLGVFGHDFFEIYWWLAAGLVVSLHNMQQIAVGRLSDVQKRLQGPVEVTSRKVVRKKRGASVSSPVK